jgi:hypothetical protein
MRINVYSQELEKEVALVNKGGHVGVRLYFDGSPRLHNTPEDDDRSAITYWLPNNEKFMPEDLAEIFMKAANLICPGYCK